MKTVKRAISRVLMAGAFNPTALLNTEIDLMDEEVRAAGGDPDNCELVEMEDPKMGALIISKSWD